VHRAARAAARRREPQRLREALDDAGRRWRRQLHKLERRAVDLRLVGEDDVHAAQALGLGELGAERAAARATIRAAVLSVADRAR